MCLVCVRERVGPGAVLRSLIVIRPPDPERARLATANAKLNWMPHINVDRRNDPQTRPTSAASRTKPRACIWTSMFPALWSVRHVCQCQTYDSESQCATGFVRVSSVSLACGITNKSRRLNLKHIDINTTSLKTRNVRHTSYHPVLNSNSCDVACGPAAGHRGMCFHLVLPCP